MNGVFLSRSTERLLVAAGFVWFLVCSLLFIADCGLQHDEAESIVVAFRMLSALSAGDWAGFSRFLMKTEYIGNFKNLLLIPGISVFGLSFVAARALCVVCGLLSLFFLWRSAAFWFGQTVAAWAFFFFAVDSVFIRAVRIGLFREELFQILLLWAGLFLVSRRRPGLGRWAGAGFVWGLGLWAKFMFIGYMLAAFGAWLFIRLLFKKDSVRADTSVRAPVFVCLLFFFLGALPVLIDNLLRDWISLRYGLGVLFGGPNAFGWDNGALGPNLLCRFYDLWRLSRGALLLEMMLPGGPPEPLASVIGAGFFLSFIGAALFAFSRRRPQEINLRALVFMLVFYPLVFVLTVLVPQCPTEDHMLILAPAWPLAAALAVFYLSSLRFGRVSASLFALTLFLCQAAVTGLVLDDIRLGRGAGWYSSLGREVVDFCRTDGIDEIVNTCVLVQTEGFACLSGGRLQVLSYRAWIREEQLPDTGDFKRFFDLFLNGKKTFFLLAEEKGLPDDGPSADPRAEIAARGGGLERIRDFEDKRGFARFVLYRVNMS